MSCPNPLCRSHSSRSKPFSKSGLTRHLANNSECLASLHQQQKRKAEALSQNFVENSKYADKRRRTTTNTQPADDDGFDNNTDNGSVIPPPQDYTGQFKTTGLPHDQFMFLQPDENTKAPQAVSYTIEQKAMASLMHTLEHMNCPDNALTHILKWAKESYDSGFKFCQQMKKVLSYSHPSP